MELAWSSFYYQPKEPDSAEEKADMDILDRIEAICIDFHGYGYHNKAICFFICIIKMQQI